MKVDYRKVSTGEMDGENVFVCDIRHNGNPFEKFLRNVEPTAVIVVPEHQIKKTIYYSNSAFLKLKKDGSPSKTPIVLFDNTGYRSYAGTPLNIYTTMEEAVTKYNEQKSKIKEDMKSHIKHLENIMVNFT